jgi:competence protein ComEC
VLVLALTRKPEALAEDCARADILVTPLQAPADCAAPIVFDGPRLARDGAVALYLDPRPPDGGGDVLRETTTGHRTRDGLPFSVLARVTYETARPWTPRARATPVVSPASAPEEDDWPAFMRRDTPDLAAFETTP